MASNIHGTLEQNNVYEMRVWRDVVKDIELEICKEQNPVLQYAA